MENETNWFAVSVLIMAIIVLGVMIIFSIYCYNIANMRLPSRSESSTMLWVAIVVAVIALVFIVISAWKLFSYPPKIIIPEKKVEKKIEEKQEMEMEPLVESKEEPILKPVEEIKQPIIKQREETPQSFSSIPLGRSTREEIRRLSAQ